MKNDCTWEITPLRTAFKIKPRGKLRYAAFLGPLSITGWSTYLAVMAGSAATLTGLVFVAVSLNISRIISTRGLPGRAAESLLQLFGVVLISTTLLIPDQTTFAIAIEILSFGVVFWLLQTLMQGLYAKARTGHPRLWVLSRVLQTQISNLPLVACGILLLRGWTPGIYWLVPGLAFSMLSGVLSAWVLMVEILR